MEKVFTNKQVWLWFTGAYVAWMLVAFAMSAYSEKQYACNTVVLDIKGELLSSYATADTSEDANGYVTYGNMLTNQITELESSATVKNIIVDVDSFGGSPVAGEEIANELKRSTKNTVAVIRTAGVSAAYWAATGADRIFASRNSDVGSIGVSLQLQNYVEKNKKEGIRYESITSGAYKGIGDPNRSLTSEERKLLQDDVNKIHKNFVVAVSENRGISEAEVEVLATGASVLGDEGLRTRLIDEIGGFAEAKEYLERTTEEEVRICIPPAQGE